MNLELKSDRENIEIRYTTDGSIPSSNSSLVKGPIHLEKSSVVTAKCFRGGQAVSGTTQEVFNKIEPINGLEIENASSGIHYKYFEGEWDVLPNFNSLSPVDEGIIQNFTLTPAKSANYFGFEYKGYIYSKNFNNCQNLSCIVY